MPNLKGKIEKYVLRDIVKPSRCLAETCSRDNKNW